MPKKQYRKLPRATAAEIAATDAFLKAAQKSNLATLRSWSGVSGCDCMGLLEKNIDYHTHLDSGISWLISINRMRKPTTNGPSPS